MCGCVTCDVTCASSLGSARQCLIPASVPGGVSSVFVSNPVNLPGAGFVGSFVCQGDGYITDLSRHEVLPCTDAGAPLRFSASVPDLGSCIQGYCDGGFEVVLLESGLSKKAVWNS
jgi:hypothetical protein